MRIPPFGVERWFVKYEFHVELNIAESCIQPFSIGELCGLAGADPAVFADLRLGYTDGLGSEDLRRAIAALYPETGPENILVTTGAIEANFLVAQALLAPGCRAVVEFPAYQQLYSVPAATGAEVVLWELGEEQGYQPDVDALERLAPPDEKLQMLTINHPHNPSGARISRQTMRRIAEFADRRDAVLHSDEVYRGLTLAPDLEPSPSARALSPRAIAVGSMSKAYGLSGARIGWIAGPADVVRRCGEIRDYVSICPSALGERLAMLALTSRDAVMARNQALARRNSVLLRDFVRRNADVLSCVLPEEGVIAFPRYRRPAGDLRPLPPSGEFCARLAEERGVLLIPGECFEREHHFRIGFGYETGILLRGLARLEEYCDEALRR